MISPVELECCFRGVPVSFSPGSVREKNVGKGGKIVGKKREKEGKLWVKEGKLFPPVQSGKETGTPRLLPASQCSHGQ